MFWTRRSNLQSATKQKPPLKDFVRSIIFFACIMLRYHVTFDLSMSGGYGYYTGIVFRAYTYGTGDAVVRGGRYDHLLEKFGKETPSIGFAIIVDELMNALSRQKISVDTIRRNIIVYNEETESNAIILAGNFREKGRCIELIRQKEGQDKSLYESYAKRKKCCGFDLSLRR